MDTSQYLDIFLDEAREHLQNLSDEIMKLEQEPDNMDSVNEIFRAAHSLKGMAGTMGYTRMQTLTHDMENVFSEVRNGTFKVQPGIIEILFKSLDALEEYVNNIQQTSDEGTNDNQNIIDALNAVLKNKGETAPAGNSASAGEEPKAEEQAQAASAANGEKGPMWQDIKITDTEIMLINKAHNENLNVYGITVYVEEACVLKAARAFLVFKALERLGEVIVSSPSAQDIEDEKFELTFSLIFISQNTKDEVKAAIKSVSEIEEAFCEPYELPAGAQKPVAEDNNDAAASVQSASAAPAAQAPAAQASHPAPTAASKPAATTGKPVVNRTVRVDIEKLDNLMNLVSELIIAKNSLVSATAAAGTGKAENNLVNEQIEYLESVTTNLHESVMKVRMVPIESVVAKFPRMIRDLSKKLDKKMELYMTGEDTELDRTVVDEIGDPLMHMLRNSADHGLEANDVRVAKGKPEVGSIFLDAYQDGNNVVIEVRDDGAGIDIEAVKQKGIERGIVSPEQAETMTEKEVIDLLFMPSFSTAKKVSDVSGRGVGLDVVKSKIEALSGEVEVKNHFGEGSSWIIRLPLTLAIIQALMVVVGDEQYAIALGSIQTIEDVAPEDIKLVRAKEVIHIRGTVIPIIRLDEILDIPPRKEDESDKKDKNLTVIIVKKGDKQAGLVVDELIGQQEVVIKSMGKYIKVPKMISGATILGNGDVALILDTNALI